MARLGAVYIVFFAAAALSITKCLGAPPSHKGGSLIDCSQYTCRQEHKAQNAAGCPHGCLCALEKSLIFPKTGFCAQDPGKLARGILIMKV
ncbi:hypothetical protein MTO96_042392 [Rhipicephalus appendiculatus]